VSNLSRRIKALEKVIRPRPKPDPGTWIVDRALARLSDEDLDSLEGVMADAQRGKSRSYTEPELGAVERYNSLFAEESRLAGLWSRDH
jgi:hypothetical protein